MPDAQAVDSPTLRSHVVFLYATVHVRVEGVMAASQCEAMEIATKQVDLDRLLNREVANDPQGVRRVEYADEITAYLVDEDGDADFERSQSYDDEMDPCFNGHMSPDVIPDENSVPQEEAKRAWLANYLASSAYAHLTAPNATNQTKHRQAAIRFFKALTKLSADVTHAMEMRSDLLLALTPEQKSLLDGIND